LYALVENAHAALAPGGKLIFETPNPENVLVGSHTFYHDPTHRNPITPTLIRFLVEHLGFAEVQIHRLHPYPESSKVYGRDPLTDRVNGAFCSAQDFAVVATKAP
jgi:O-antigen chain-terminating methyltransferase